MKKILLASILSLALFSCERDEVLYKGGEFISFANSSSTEFKVTENEGTANINLLLSTAPTSDLTVNFEYTDGSALTGVHYERVVSIVIPAGSKTGVLEIPVVDDEENNSSRTFDVKLLSSSDATLKMGYGDAGAVLKNVVIVNDDCPSKNSFYFGNLNVEDVGYGSTPGVGSANANGDCDILILANNISGVGGANTTNGHKYVVLFTPTNADGSEGTVELPLQIARDVLGTISGGVTVSQRVSGTGYYNSNTGEIVIDYDLNVYNNNTGAVVNVGADYIWTGTSVITKL